MGPYIDCLVVNHEDTLQNFRICVEIYPISGCDVLVVLHERRSFLKLSNIGLIRTIFLAALILLL